MACGEWWKGVCRNGVEERGKESGRDGGKGQIERHTHIPSLSQQIWLWCLIITLIYKSTLSWENTARGVNTSYSCLRQNYTFRVPMQRQPLTAFQFSRTTSKTATRETKYPFREESFFISASVRRWNNLAECIKIPSDRNEAWVFIIRLLKLIVPILDCDWLNRVPCHCKIQHYLSSWPHNILWQHSILLRTECFKERKTLQSYKVILPDCKGVCLLTCTVFTYACQSSASNPLVELVSLVCPEERKEKKQQDSKW